MPQTIDLSSLQRSLRLLTQADVEALLAADQIREAFRMYRNRCLISDRHVGERLPSWKDVDEYLYDLQLSGEYRLLKRSGQEGNDALLEYVSRICHDKPYQIMPHIAAFTLRVEKFWRSPRGAWFDVGCRAEDAHDRVFDRYRRIMELLRFLLEQEMR
ncbi:hypothetical protein GGR50DRAFT_518899 [Xylaria sp. CBS 124048]|nr:hypothetical protein GGR50DRAFT_518899 [Xylaria sp. CBS 124048]